MSRAKNFVSGLSVLGALSAILLAACVDSSPVSDTVAASNKQLEQKGSPFRYVARDGSSMVLTLMPLPVGPTKAVPALAQQAMAAIEKEELRKGRSVANLEEVRHLQDGREVWVLKTLGDGGIAYVVAFENPSNPKSNIRATGPNTYAK